MSPGITIAVANPRTTTRWSRVPSRSVRRPRTGRAGSGVDRRTALAVAALAVALASTAGTVATIHTVTPALPTTAAPFTGGPAGCTVKDPTTSGCVTPTTAHALTEIERTFGGYRKGPKIRSIGCWDAHAWNPTSDHPKGKACDIFLGKSGVFASGAPLANGWEVAHWLRANAAALHVHYIIWQGRIWDSVERTGDAGGWGHPYNGGGIYNARSATGGHFDHVHVSFTS